MAAASVDPELEAVVVAAVRAVVSRHRAAAERRGAPVDPEAVVRDAMAVLRAVLGVLGPAQPATSPAGGRVIVERDVLDAAPAGRLVLARGSVLTPLARDTAGERGVELVWEAS